MQTFQTNSWHGDRAYTYRAEPFNTVYEQSANAKRNEILLPILRFVLLIKLVIIQSMLTINRCFQ